MSKEGHEVRYFIGDKKEKDIADGFVAKSKDWEKDVEWADIVIFAAGGPSTRPPRGQTPLTPACCHSEVGNLQLFAVDEAAAVWRATTAADAERPGRKLVVDGEFLAGADPAATEKKNMAADDADAEIGIATVIDAFGAGAADGAVDTPETTHAKHAE